MTKRMGTWCRVCGYNVVVWRWPYPHRHSLSHLWNAFLIFIRMRAAQGEKQDAS